MSGDNLVPRRIRESQAEAEVKQCLQELFAWEMEHAESPRSFFNEFYDEIVTKHTVDSSTNETAENSL